MNNILSQELLNENKIVYASARAEHFIKKKRENNKHICNVSSSVYFHLLLKILKLIKNDVILYSTVHLTE